MKQHRSRPPSALARMATRATRYTQLTLFAANTSSSTHGVLIIDRSFAFHSAIHRDRATFARYKYRDGRPTLHRPRAIVRYRGGRRTLHGPRHHHLLQGRTSRSAQTAHRRPLQGRTPHSAQTAHRRPLQGRTPTLHRPRAHRRPLRGRTPHSAQTAHHCPLQRRMPTLHRPHTVARYRAEAGAPLVRDRAPSLDTGANRPHSPVVQHVRCSPANQLAVLGQPPERRSSVAHSGPQGG